MLNIVLIVSLCFIWGGTWVAIKIGLSDAPPFFAAAFRFLLAALVLGGMMVVRRTPLPRDRRDLYWTIISGLFMYFGSYAAVYYAEQFISAGLAAIIFTSFPFFVAIGAHYYLPGERLNWLKVLGLTIGFAGIVVIFGGKLAIPEPGLWWAMGVMLISPLASAVASIIVKRHLVHQDPTAMNFLQMLVGVAVLFPFAMYNEQLSDLSWTPKTIGTILYLAILGSAYTFVVYYRLLKTMEATKLSLIAFVTPVVASLLGWVILDERLSLATVIGAVMVFVGIWIVNVLAARSPTQETAPVGMSHEPAQTRNHSPS